MKFKLIQTEEKNKLYWNVACQESSSPDMMKAICVYPEVTYQVISGFGGAFTEASAYNLDLMNVKRQEEILEAYFGNDGLHYNLCRTHINSCDFGLGNYAYLEEESDKELTGFHVSRDEKYLIPMIKKAIEKSAEEIIIIASPWSPPAFMKSNKEMNHGGYLLEEYYEMWADYIVRYLKEYRQRGIKISMLTVQNEPQAVQTWDSCIYSSEQEKIMVRDYLGPALNKNGFGDVKIFIWDHNKEIMYERAKEILSDPNASEFISGVAFHWYSGDHFESVKLVNELYPKKELIFTEGCVEYSRFADSNEIKKAEMYAHDMIGNFNSGMNGYIDWNLLLDEKGGPNHVKNFCAAPIMCDPKKESYEKRLSYFYIGHFSRFIKRGARRIAVSKYSDKLETIGFLNPDGERVLVVLNRSEESMEFSLREYDLSTNVIIAPHSIMTICYKEEEQ